MEKIEYKKIYREFSKNPKAYIEKCEKRFSDFIDICCDKVINEKADRIYICGQSGSGKTTTSMRLSEKLTKMGKTVHIVELDDFFLPREKHRINKAGQPDFETIFALDLDAIYKFGKNIKEGKSVTMPDFDFKTGDKGGESALVIGEDDILVIEGIHSFNERILKTFETKNNSLKLYVTVNSCVEFENTSLSNNDLRFARRLIRDYYHRNANPDWTIELWHLVRAGEKRYAGGYMKNADILFNTFLNYELFLLKNDFLRLSKMGFEIAESKGYYKTLHNKYKLIDETDKINVPKQSILNEFI